MSTKSPPPTPASVDLCLGALPSHKGCGRLIGIEPLLMMLHVGGQSAAKECRNPSNGGTNHAMLISALLPAREAGRRKGIWATSKFQRKVNLCPSQRPFQFMGVTDAPAPKTERSCLSSQRGSNPGPRVQASGALQLRYVVRAASGVPPAWCSAVFLRPHLRLARGNSWLGVTCSDGRATRPPIGEWKGRKRSGALRVTLRTGGAAPADHCSRLGR